MEAGAVGQAPKRDSLGNELRHEVWKEGRRDRDGDVIMDMGMGGREE